MIKDLVFDFGGVLTTIDTERALQKFRELGVPAPEEYINSYCQKGPFFELENGDIDADEFCKRLGVICGREVTFEQAKDMVKKALLPLGERYQELLEKAYSEHWMDVYENKGKQSGAFSCGVYGVHPYIKLNYTDTLDDAFTLAHELGNAYHNLQIENERSLNQDYPMPVAETASTFNENVVTNFAIDHASSDDEKLSLLEGQLSDVTQIICDIYSRFTFEASVFDNRADEFMGADRLSSLMLEAQKKAYGDGLDENFMHQYMWLCKGHYYSGGLSFYNFPYAFGGLFARGLYAKYEKEGKAFVDTYKEMLRATAVMDIEDCAKIAGIDLTNKEFWCEGLEVIRKEIDEFCELVQ